MQKVFLSLDDCTLGYLVQGESGYIFHADKEGINDACVLNSLKMKFFTLNRSGMKEYTEIPNHFIQYLDGVDREDIIEEANIYEDDNLFVKLYKIAGLNHNVINFKISQG